MNDAQIEQEVKDKGLNVAPRVTKKQIDALMARVVYRFDQPEGTTSSIAHAFLDGEFLLATGHSACVSRENFNAESGRKWAKDKAEEQARNKLWELEGYALRSALREGGLRITEDQLDRLHKVLPKSAFVAFAHQVGRLMGFVDGALNGDESIALQAHSGLDFGTALDALKAGHRVARAGWNGKGMWLALSGSLEGRQIPAGQFWSVHNADHARAQGGTAKVLPCITMKTADNAILMGWLASQTDMLAEDWAIVE